MDACARHKESPEASARRARYAAIRSLMDAGDILLTAHHQDDQAETLLLQMVRGAGPRGLASMPVCARFEPGWLARPLLDVPRAALHNYAKSRGLRWIEDRSNDDTRYDRNFIRHTILRRLRERWPSVTRTLGRVAAHQAEAAQLMGECTAMDLAGGRGTEPGTLSVAALQDLPPARVRHVIRACIRELHLPVPGTSHLDRILYDVLQAGPDSAPLVRWPGVEVRRYRDLVYVMSPLTEHDTTRVVAWQLGKPLMLTHGRLGAQPVEGEGLSTRCCADGIVEVRFRRGGERCRLVGREYSRSLKKLLQERGILPWLRDRIPLVYVAGCLAAVAGLWVCEPFQARPGELGWVLHWAENEDAPTGRSDQ